MKVTSQTRSPTCVIPTFCPAKTWLQLTFRACQQIRPQFVTMTVASAVIMVVASFTMAELSNEQLTQDLRARATVDGLTGLLNRTAFLDLAAHEVEAGHGE